MSFPALARAVDAAVAIDADYPFVPGQLIESIETWVSPRDGSPIIALARWFGATVVDREVTA